MSRKKRGLLALVVFLVVLVLVEGIARLVSSDRSRQALPTIESDPDLLWRLKPLPDDPEHGTNTLGLRDTTYRPEAQLRLLLLGDSVAYGAGVGSAKKAFPYLLERELETLTRGTVELVNSACPGWGTAQETRSLERSGPELQPRGVILQFNLDDVIHVYRGPDMPQRFLQIDTRHGVPGLHGALLRGSEAYAGFARWRRGEPRPTGERAVRGLTASPLAPDLEAAWTTSEAELDRLADLCAAEQLPLLIVVTPYRFQLADPSGTRAPQARLLAWGKRRGVQVVDLLPKLARIKGLVLGELFVDDTHLSETGHRVTGAALGKPVAAWLEANGVVDRKR